MWNSLIAEKYNTVNTTMSVVCYLHCASENKFYEAIHVPSDGSCMFHAFSYSLFGNTLLSEDLRIECCEYENNNSQWLCLYTDDGDLVAFNRRVTELSNPTVYGSYVELYCLSVIHNVEIIIYRQVSVRGIEVLTTIDRLSSVHTVKLIYVNNNHYMPLIERNSSTCSNDAMNNNPVTEFSCRGRDFETDDVNATSNNVIEHDHTYAIGSDSIENYPIVSDFIRTEHSYVKVNMFENDEVSNPYIGTRTYNEDVLKSQYSGTMNLTCQFCKAFYFHAEINKNDKVFTKCCMRGKYIFDFNFEVPDLIKSLICKTHPESNNFGENIRQFNSALAFASFGASVSTGNIQNISGFGPYCFKVQGIIQHLSSNLREDDPAKIKYAQLYFVDSSLANQYRHNRNSCCSQSLLMELDQLIRSINPYAEMFYIYIARTRKTRNGALFW